VAGAIKAPAHHNLYLGASTSEERAIPGVASHRHLGRIFWIARKELQEQCRPHVYGRIGPVGAGSTPVNLAITSASAARALCYA
jgi:hypothetical protein